MIFIQYLFLFLTIFCWAPSADAAASPAADNNIHISADQMNQSATDGVYTAEGNVVVRWQEMNLVADRIRYEAAANMLHASGAVLLSKGTTVLKGESLTLNTITGRAEMDATLLTLPDSGLKVSSAKLVRLDETRYSAVSTELTTCELPDPAWMFAADSLKVDTQGYATGRNVIFYIKGTPVLYLPWIAFPVVLEKKSGLLFPEFGYSKKKGFRLDLPAYLVISPSQDLQLDLDIMTQKGVGAGVDYRYIRARGSEGRLGAYQIYDQDSKNWRWQLSQEHKEIFSPDANLRMAVNLNSDRTFLKDFGDKSGEYNRQSNDTVFNMLKSWRHYAATTYLRYSEDLYAADNRTTLQTLPSLGLTGVRQQMFSAPLYFDFDATLVNFYRDSAPDGQRLHFYPRLTVHPFSNPYLHTSLFAGAHVRGYATNRLENDTRLQARDGDLLPEAGARLSAAISRIYDTEFQILKKIRHEMIPEIGYGFVPKRSQERLPDYDYTDRIIQRNMLTLAVSSVLNGKFVSADTTEYRELSRIKLSADYALEGGRRDLLSLVEIQRPWSDLKLESETSLTRQLLITFDARYNPYQNHFSTLVAGLEADDRRGNSLAAAYQMARNEVEYFEGRLTTRLLTPLNLSYTARYSFDRSDFLESVYAAEYRHKCWSVNLAVHQRPGNQSYTVNFNLAGMGGK